MDASISAASLKQSILGSEPPLVIDVRRNERFRESPYLMKGALRRDPERVVEWKSTLPRAAQVVVYCVHGHEVSQNVAKSLAARYLQGGIEAWRELGGEVAEKPTNSSSRWVTRERPKIDRIACPWLIRRFVDPDAEFLYVPTPEVRRTAQEKTAVPYDIPDVEFSHDGELCSFDTFLRKFHLEKDPALAELAVIVRGADTNRLNLAPQAAGLAAISLGLSRNFANDHEMLEHGMVVYDALYAWCRNGKDEIHTWNPAAYR
ncbi:MAG TPA: chromate resistance protein ChrB domain-containing protein [Burkholderiales bacterium]|nr:chromate resistance protein ChrB domain-containing protein [Burkholderiales bacterium]